MLLLVIGPSVPQNELVLGGVVYRLLLVHQCSHDVGEEQGFEFGGLVQFRQNVLYLMH